MNRWKPTQEELDKILKKHLRYVDLRYAILQRANLRYADLEDADLEGANLQRANLKDADLQRANLRGANLKDADLRGANLDYSCLPLWCGSRNMIVDDRIARQIAAHFCALTCDSEEFQQAREALLPYAMKSHVAGWILEEGEQ